MTFLSSTQKDNKYADEIDVLKKEIGALQEEIESLMGKTEVGTGVLPFESWNFAREQARQRQNQPLMVAKVVQRLSLPAPDGSPLFTVSIAHGGKFVVGCAKGVEPTEVEEGARVGLERVKHAIKKVFPMKVEARVKLMEVDERPTDTYEDIGGCAEQLRMIREIVELPLSEPARFAALGVEPPKGVLLFGPPGTGKTLLARAVANRTNAAFIRVIGSELVQKFVGEGPRLVREVFRLARSKRAAVLFLDEIDAIGGARQDEDGDGEVQRTMLQILTELDGFAARGNVKVIMATNRPDILDPALVRPGRIDRKIEFGLPTAEGREAILALHAKRMNVKDGIRWNLLARLCPNTSGAELRSVCTEAGIFAIRDKRRMVTETDFVKAINKVTKEYARFSSAPKYMVYN